MKYTIKKGDKYLCIKDYLMNPEDFLEGEDLVAYKKGKVYISDKDGSIPSEIYTEHYMEGFEEFFEYFQQISDDIFIAPVEITNTALRYNDGKPEYSLLHLPSLEPCVRVLAFGKNKYSRDNWLLGFPITSILDSMMRHIAELQRGEFIDPETNESHIGAIQCNALFLGNKNNIMDLENLKEEFDKWKQQKN